MTQYEASLMLWWTPARWDNSVGVVYRRAFDRDTAADLKKLVLRDTHDLSAREFSFVGGNASEHHTNLKITNLFTMIAPVSSAMHSKLQLR